MDFAVTTRAVPLTFTFKIPLEKANLQHSDIAISILLIVIALAGGVL